MKELFAGVVILFVVGIGAFLYRNTMERPGVIMPEGVCTAEAKLCPDGSSVGRSGPACEFAPCVFPNVEIPEAGIMFVVPAGYVADEAKDASLLAAFKKPSAGGEPSHTITVRRYLLSGRTGDEVILANTTYQPAGEGATDFARFSDFNTSTKTFRETTIERFEGLVHTSYFLVREADVLRFDIVEHDVIDWMSTTPARSFPEHRALMGLLETIR